MRWCVHAPVECKGTYDVCEFESASQMCVVRSLLQWRAAEAFDVCARRDAADRARGIDTSTHGATSVYTLYMPHHADMHS